MIEVNNHLNHCCNVTLHPGRAFRSLIWFPFIMLFLSHSNNFSFLFFKKKKNHAAAKYRTWISLWNWCQQSQSETSSSLPQILFSTNMNQHRISASSAVLWTHFGKCVLSFAKPTVAGQVSESYHELVFVLGSAQAIFTSLSKPSPRHVQEHFSREKIYTTVLLSVF